MNLFTSAHFRKPTLNQMMLFAVLALCGAVDIPRSLNLFGTTLLGACVLAIAGLTWALFLIHPVLPHSLLKSILFLIMFEIYSLGTMSWSHTGMDGVQLLVVGLGFLGLIVISARETAMDVRNGLALLKVMAFCSAVAVGLYLYVVYQLPHLGADEDIPNAVSPRGFALYSLTAVGASLGMWRGSRASKYKALIPLGWACAITFTVALSMSRTALVGCLILFPLSILLRLNWKSVMLSVATLLAGAALFVLAVLAYKPLYDRFFGFDASMKVGGVSVNASGRTKVWDVLLHSIGDDWVFGKGVASSEVIIRSTFNGLIGQPHNDYLRYYYDTGAFGLSLYLCFALSFVFKTLGSLRRSIRNHTPDYPLHVAALLSFTAVSWSMLTDNSVCYSFVMLPLAIVMGSSLGAGQIAFDPLADQAVLEPEEHGFEPIFFEPSSQPMARDVRIVT